MKEKIIEFNKRFGLNTEFINDSEIEGYSLGNTIYINENSSDIEKVNKHELLHFFEDDETFKEIKKEVLKIDEERLKKIRREYYLRYCGLYTEEEIQNGIIDTEIVIDILIDNSIFTFDQGLKLGDYVLKEITNNLEQKRYLNLSLNSKINNMNISKWDKLFILNYYDGKEHIYPEKEGRQERIKEDIRKELEKLYNLKEEDFKINPNSKDIIREYESEIKALEARGEPTKNIINNKESYLWELANRFSKQLYEEYRHIVDFIKESKYEDSFKVLMLKETLSKTYKLDTKEGKKTIVNKRDMHETIASHMTLNETVLNTIYNNVDNYNNFANLYFAGLEIFNQTIAKKNNISLDNVETYGMGHWVKFDGKTSDEENYLRNAQELSSLVKDTPWCTKSLASSQLSEGDFYVFVDNGNNPHIAVKMNGDEIDEVRGILNGNSQELEEEYRKVAISFLENNKEIKNGEKWLRKEEWNKRLINYIESIENKTFTKEDVPKLIEDYFGKYEYKAHGSENSNKEKLEKLLPRIKKYIAEYYNCTKEEIAIGDVLFWDPMHKDMEVCPYKVIFGDAYFGNSKIRFLGCLEVIFGYAYFSSSPVQSIGNLRTIGGSANFTNSQVQRLGNLTMIGGSAFFNNSQVQSLDNLTTIGGNAYFEDSQIQRLDNLTTIGGNAEFSNSEVQSLGNLVTIGGYADFKYSQVQSLGNLTTIGGDVGFYCSKIKSLDNLTTIGGDVDFRNTQVKSLDNLKIIGGDASFINSQVQRLGNLTMIGGSAFFNNSQVQCLDNLTTIGGNAYFEDSQIQRLDNLTTIGGNADFSNSEVQCLDNLVTIGGYAIFKYSQVQSLGNLTTIGGDVDFYFSKIKSLDNLTTIGGDVDFNSSQLKSLDNLKIIGGDASFDYSKIESLNNLTTIGGNAYFGFSKIKGFDNLESIGGTVFADDELMKLYHIEFDETGHRIKKENAIKR